MDGNLDCTGQPGLYAVCSFTSEKESAAVTVNVLAEDSRSARKIPFSPSGMAHVYMSPITAIGAGSYVVWQNIINSWQLWKQRKNIEAGLVDPTKKEV